MRHLAWFSNTVLFTQNSNFKFTFYNFLIQLNFWIFGSMWVELKVKTQIILDSWRLCCCERKKRQFDSCCRAKFCCCESNRFWLSHIFHSSIHQCHASIGKSFLQRELNFVSTFGDFGVQRWRSIWFWLWFRTVRRQIFMSQTNSFVSTIYMEIQMVTNTVG